MNDSFCEAPSINMTHTHTHTVAQSQKDPQIQGLEELVPPATDWPGVGPDWTVDHRGVSTISTMFYSFFHK